MDFSLSPKTQQLLDEVRTFVAEQVIPAESTFLEEAHARPSSTPATLRDLRNRARDLGLWNLFSPHPEQSAHSLNNLEYAPLAEAMGWSPWLAPQSMNCAAPDTGNMEILTQFATSEQQETWLAPLLAGEIRSCFAMTEPDVASSDATNIATTIMADGGSYIVNGTKWWSTGAASEEAAVCLLLGVTDEHATRHARHSVALIAMAEPGVTVERDLPLYGAHHPNGGHPQIRFENVRIPRENLIGEVGRGFHVAQARLGPGRLHHCMRLLGMAERAYSLLLSRAQQRQTFGRDLAQHGVVRQWIAQARIRIDQARLLVLHAAWTLDTRGADEAREELAAIKIAVPAAVAWVIDRSIQAHGALGFTDDVPLSALWVEARSLQIADGPDEVHEQALARWLLQRGTPMDEPPPPQATP